MTRSHLVEAAADYLNRGLSVIALTGKTPNVKVHRHGLHQAIVGPVESDADWHLLEEAFDHPDSTGVGILTNFPYVVVDIDGEDGAKQWLDLTDDVFMTTTWVAKTGRGLHLWYGTAERTGTIKLGPKLDLKGDGGYVAAPPSLHPDGHTYEWLVPPDSDYPPFEVPEPLRIIIEDRNFDRNMTLAAKEVRKRAYGPRYQEGDTVFYAQANHDALIKNMATAVEGNRNAYLHWAAATLAEEFAEEEEFERLSKAAIAAGLEREETRRTLRSARRAHG